MTPYYEDEMMALYHGDCLAVLPELTPVDAIVTDPPYGLSFMGKGWDHAVPGVEFWQAALRAAKPGAHLLAFGGTRTYHRLMCAIEDAGWELRDCIMWVYGTGFPKSLDVSKAIDKEAGAEREVSGVNPSSRPNSKKKNLRGFDRREGGTDESAGSQMLTIPATNEAIEWEGWGTALKPAWEPIIVCRKPLDGTVAQNMLRHGVGGLNIDACRVGTDDELGGGAYTKAGNRRDLPGTNRSDSAAGMLAAGKVVGREYQAPTGRWPANLIHDGSDEAVAGFPRSKSTGGTALRSTSIGGRGAYSGGGEQAYANYGDDGSAARFFYCAKASRAEREEGLEALESVTGAEAVGREEGAAGTKSPRAGAGRTRAQLRNDHPTVKPLALMRYLCRLVTPPGGVVLDPFAGSGSTLVAARQEGFRAIGIEIDEHACEIAAKRTAQGVG